jgi:hypothetical protein
MATKLKAFAMPSVYEYLEAELSSGQSDERRMFQEILRPIAALRPHPPPANEPLDDRAFKNN